MLTLAGIGSHLSRDDAIGLILVGELMNAGQPRGINAMLWEDADALTLAQYLLDAPGPVLVVDCAELNLTAGSWRLITEREGRLALNCPGVSSHGLGITEALCIARELGFQQPFYVFGIQPFDLSPRSGLTPEMLARVPELVAALQTSLRSLGYSADRAGCMHGPQLLTERSTTG